MKIAQVPEVPHSDTFFVAASRFAVFCHVDADADAPAPPDAKRNRCKLNIKPAFRGHDSSAVEHVTTQVGSCPNSETEAGTTLTVSRKTPSLQPDTVV
ncbi:hypothetical protein BWQ96_09922 [Gracilariopsis chorda]|uniref:Uncharacterized protein n=1 Tax=Gracilariopsis chorda TaxID=448386 RepID=A0A2V3IE55_9FLOR|nr:hypothetical protein BWQ96_09922 [Gracilariopsis chorda]|eukprot:PXF40366.1 hypothetical protein BWQ96_09922 [Gracilariopsis chorda]